MKKCAFIRKQKGEIKCPFGLPITDACLQAGDSVENMAPLEMFDESKQEQVQKANKRVYIYYRTGKRCIFAVHIMKEEDSVNCNWGDHAAGAGLSNAFNGSPLYPQTFSGQGLDGLYAFPLGFYSDNNSSRNLFHGLFSLVGSEEGEIIKEAIQKANLKLFDKISENKKLNEIELTELKNIINNINWGAK